MDPREKAAKEASRKRNKELLSRAFNDVVGKQLKKAQERSKAQVIGKTVLV